MFGHVRALLVHAMHLPATGRRMTPTVTQAQSLMCVLRSADTLVWLFKRTCMLFLLSMLCRLPVVLAAGSRPGLTTLLSRITQQVKDLLQAAQLQQQRQQGMASHGAPTSEPALKRHRSAEAATSSRSGSASIDPHELLDMLLAAYAAATGSSAAGQDAGWAWRLEYLAMLQELLPLHAPLLERLLGALCRSATAADVAPQQVCIIAARRDRVEQQRHMKPHAPCMAQAVCRSALARPLHPSKHSEQW
jgi:hypothetical protein